MDKEWDGSTLMGMGYYRAIRVVEETKSLVLWSGWEDVYVLELSHAWAAN